MRILVCGGRDFDDYDSLSSILISHLSAYDPENVTIISGHARGADKLGEIFATKNNCRLVIFPADWDKYRKAAGPIRNQQMIDEGKPDLVVAFPGGRGTEDMIRRSVKAGIKTIKVHKDGQGYSEIYKEKEVCKICKGHSRFDQCSCHYA